LPFFELLSNVWIAIHVGQLGREICVGLGTIMNFGVKLGNRTEALKANSYGC